MNVGDLVIFMPGVSYGSLTAVKYFERMNNRIGGKVGLVVSLHGDNVVVAFGDDPIVMRKEYLEVVNEGR